MLAIRVSASTDIPNAVTVRLLNDWPSDNAVRLIVCYLVEVDKCLLSGGIVFERAESQGEGAGINWPLCRSEDRTYWDADCESTGGWSGERGTRGS